MNNKNYGSDYVLYWNNEKMLKCRDEWIAAQFDI